MPRPKQKKPKGKTPAQLSQKQFPKPTSILKSSVKAAIFTKQLAERLHQLAEKRKFEDFLKNTKYFIKDPKLSRILRNPSEEILAILQIAFQLGIKPKTVAEIFSKYLSKKPQYLKKMLMHLQMQNPNAVASMLLNMQKNINRFKKTA